jgi:hypothetical protein
MKNDKGEILCSGWADKNNDVTTKQEGKENEL